jgi:hypothetical protein
MENRIYGVRWAFLAHGSQSLVVDLISETSNTLEEEIRGNLNHRPLITPT